MRHVIKPSILASELKERVEKIFNEHTIKATGGDDLVSNAIAFEYGKKQGCNFAFVETMSFQALEFYQKLGFKLELKRDGYSRGTSFCYLKKNL